MTSYFNKSEKYQGFDELEVKDFSTHEKIFLKNASDFYSRIFFKDYDDQDVVKLDSSYSMVDKKNIDALRDIYSSFNYDKLPGLTPLDKSKSLLYLFKESLGDIKTGSVNHEEMASLLEAFLNLDKDDYFLLDSDSDLSLESFLKKNKDFDLLEVLSKKNILKETFRSNSNKKKKKVKGEDFVGFRRMDYKDFHSLITKKVYQDFEYKFLTKQYNVEKRYSTENIGNELDIIFVDYSGSMCSYSKKNMVCSLVYSFLHKVLKEKSKLAIFFFENKIIENFYINSEIEARDFFKKIIKFDPELGYTDINYVLKEFYNDFFKVDSFFSEISGKASVIIINDGQDVVDEEEEFPFFINCISIEAENKKLKSLCTNHNGKFLLRI